MGNDFIEEDFLPFFRPEEPAPVFHKTVEKLCYQLIGKLHGLP